MSPEKSSPSLRERLAIPFAGYTRKVGATALGPKGSPRPESVTEKIDTVGLIESLPETLEVGDEHITELVQGIDLGSINYALDEANMPTITDDMIEREITIATPKGLPEGADKTEWAIPLPVRGAVSVVGIDSWANGRVDGQKNGKPSRKTIRDYARMDGRTAPPVQRATVYVQPDGRTFWELSGDGAHRLAAAKRRDDHSIYARDVSITLLNRPVEFDTSA